MQSKNTELDLVLVPASYWRLFLQPKLEQVCLSKMRAKKRTVESDDTKVILKVTQRSVDNVTKSFDKTDIDWSVIEKQLTLWANRFPDRGLTIDVSFNYNYVETGPLPTTSSRRTDKRGRFSTTRRMLEERDTQLDAEEESTG